MNKQAKWQAVNRAAGRCSCGQKPYPGRKCCFRCLKWKAQSAKRKRDRISEQKVITMQVSSPSESDR